MEHFTVEHPVELIEALMSEVGYSTRTRARNALKRGEILVNGKTAFRGNDVLEPDTKVSILSKEEVEKQARTGGTGRKPRASHTTNVLRAPFPVVYEDENIFVYEKPANWVCASPNPKVKTTYTAVKAYLENKTEEQVDVHFVNKLPREASGLLVVAKSREWRQHLQEHWGSFAKGLYVMVEGHLAADDALLLRPENGDPYELDYRTMRATDRFTLLKFKSGYDVIRDMLPALRKQDCLLIGVGKTAPDPIKRGGIHLFALAIQGPDGETINVKTRVPNEFLKLVRGGSSPKPAPRAPRRGERSEERSERKTQSEKRRSTQSRKR